MVYKLNKSVQSGLILKARTDRDAILVSSRSVPFTQQLIGYTGLITNSRHSSGECEEWFHYTGH